MKKNERNVERITFLDIVKGLLFIVVFFGIGIIYVNLFMAIFSYIVDYTVKNTENKVILFVLLVLFCIGYGFFGALSKASEYGFSSGKFLSHLFDLKKKKKQDDEEA